MHPAGRAPRMRGGSPHNEFRYFVPYTNVDLIDCLLKQRNGLSASNP